MNKKINSSLNCFAILLLLPLVCTQQNASSQDQKNNKSETKEIASGANSTSTGTTPTSTINEVADGNSPKKNIDNTNLPKNWPWRGICFQSENSDASDIKYLASIGVNFVRIQIKPAIRAKRKKLDPKQCFFDELNWADSVLDECKKNGITSLIAFNHLVLDPKVGVDEKSPEFWVDRKYIDSTLSMVSIIANRFKNRGDELSAYEVMGEPVIQKKGGSVIPPNLQGFFTSVLKEIRKVDQERWFLLTPGPWGRPTNYAGFDGFTISDSKLIYGAHMYLPDQFTHQGLKKREKNFVYPGKIRNEFWDKSAIEKKFSDLKKFEKRHNCLVYIGEFQATRWSKGADEWVKDVVSTLDKNQWSWSLFAFEAGTTSWDPYFDVKNKSAKSTEWEIEYVGKNTPLWKYMISEYEKNKK